MPMPENSKALAGSIEIRSLVAMPMTRTSLRSWALAGAFNPTAIAATRAAAVMSNNC
jgi:hypothetical protein